MSISRPKRKKRPVNHIPRAAGLSLVDPGDWIMQGGALPEANQAYGFKERQVAQAAVTAYIETFMAAEDEGAPVARPALVAAMVQKFEAEVGYLTSR